MDHHTSALGKVMDDPKVRNKLSQKMLDMLEFVGEAETSTVFELYPEERYKDGGVAFETLYLATCRNLSHSNNIMVIYYLKG